jgi:hypothetical protein
MEIMEVYKFISSFGDHAYIYEFRGRYLKSLQTPAETNQTGCRFKGKNPRYLYVAAENLYDAVVHLHARHPDFFVQHAMQRGNIKIPPRERKKAIRRQARLRRKAERLAANTLPE